MIITIKDSMQGYSHGGGGGGKGEKKKKKNKINKK